MFRVTLRERARMKYMGYKVRCFFQRANTIPFHQDFISMAEAMYFAQRGEAVGTKLLYTVEV